LRRCRREIYGVDDYAALTQEFQYNWDDSVTGGTHSAANAIFAANVDSDSAIEILTGGESTFPDPTGTKGQLTILDWNNIAITEETRQSWVHHVGAPQAKFVRGVYALDVEPDNVVEILTGGETFDNGSNYRVGQLRIWNWKSS